MEEEQESRPQALGNYAEGERPQYHLQLLSYNCQRWVSDYKR